ncbi:MAG: cell division protein FtsQ/DivIB [Pseudomonadota bacterium]
MRPLTAEPRDKRRGPGPSRLWFRAERLWKKAWVRRIGLSVLPALVAALALWQIAQSESVRHKLIELRDTAMAQLSQRPEFAVRTLRVEGATLELNRRIAEMIPIEPGMSSLSLDVAELQARITDLSEVRTAHVALVPGGVLQITVVERLAVALWRDGEGRLWQIDREGVAVASAVTRAGYPELPIVLGEGAPGAVGEALVLLRAIPAIAPRVRGIVRVGKRRWDIVLDRGQRIMLPEQGALAALARLSAWEMASELLGRDISVVDLRLAARPTVRMTPDGAELYRLRRAARGAVGEDT